MYTNTHLKVTKIASKSSIKPELAAVAFFGDKVIATDSFRALEILVPQGERTEQPVMLNAALLKKRVKLDKHESLSAEDMAKVARTEPVVGRYPDVEEIMKQAEKNDSITVSMNGRYLAEVCTILAGFNKFEAISLVIPTVPNKPILLVAKGDMGKDGKTQVMAKGLIMPMNR